MVNLELGLSFSYPLDFVARFEFLFVVFQNRFWCDLLLNFNNDFKLSIYSNSWLDSIELDQSLKLKLTHRNGYPSGSWTELQSEKAQIPQGPNAQ